MGFLGVQPISGVSKERVTLWSGCTGQTALAGFLGQRPKWDGATPSPSGEPTTSERSGEVIVGYTGASTVTHSTPTEARLKFGVLHLSISLPYARAILIANRAVLRLFGASFPVVVRSSIPSVYDRGLVGFVLVARLASLTAGSHRRVKGRRKSGFPASHAVRTCRFALAIVRHRTLAIFQ